MKVRKGVRKEFCEEMVLDAGAEQVFPLLCPVREYDWIDGWQCEMVHSESGYAEDGCVFRTFIPGQCGAETWVVSRYEPSSRIEFVRTNNSRAIIYCISLENVGDMCRAVWEQTQIGLDALGNATVEDMSQDAYSSLMKWLEKALNHWLATGEKLARPE